MVVKNNKPANEEVIENAGVKTGPKNSYFKFNDIDFPIRGTNLQVNIKPGNTYDFITDSAIDESYINTVSIQLGNGPILGNNGNSSTDISSMPQFKLISTLGEDGRFHMVQTNDVPISSYTLAVVDEILKDTEYTSADYIEWMSGNGEPDADTINLIMAKIPVTPMGVITELSEGTISSLISYIESDNTTYDKYHFTSGFDGLELKSGVTKETTFIGALPLYLYMDMSGEGTPFKSKIFSFTYSRDGEQELADFYVSISQSSMQYDDNEIMSESDIVIAPNGSTGEFNTLISEYYDV